MGLPIEWPIIEARTDWDRAQAALEAAGLGDGLPIVPPTEARIEAMLDGITDPDAEVGWMPPLMGPVTARAVAYNCVIAGCKPGELTIVLAATLATLEPQFNLLGLATTTGSAAIMTIVHGPIAMSLGLNSSTNCMGPGNRANAAIGRAIGLVLRNIGGAAAGVGDMATVGQPAKYTCCFAEAAGGPLPRLPARRGLPAHASAVTVLGVSGTAEVLPSQDTASPRSILDPMAHAMVAAWHVSGASKQPDAPEQIFILPPELAEALAAHGWGLAAIQDHIFAAAAKRGARIATSPEDIHPIVCGGAGVKMAHLPLWGGGSRTVTRLIG